MHWHLVVLPVVVLVCGSVFGIMSGSRVAAFTGGVMVGVGITAIVAFAAISSPAGPCHRG